MKYIKTYILLLLAVLALPAQGRNRLNNELMNRPYADMRTWHLGFSIGTFASDLLFNHNGLVEDNKQWRIDQPDYQPGFCVNGLANLRLGSYFSLRFTPGLYFGSRDIKMVDITDRSIERQNIKSVFIVAPIELKYSALRDRNIRPYITTGLMPAFDVNKKNSTDILQLNTTDCYITAGFGCDFYLPYFKLSPELKFCFGLTDVLRHERPDLAEDPAKFRITRSLTDARSKMLVLTFYFE